MLKKSTLLLLLAFAGFCANAQEKWFNQKINEKVSVNFPVQPRQINENSFGVRDDNGVIFLVTVVDLLKTTGLSLAEFNNKVVVQQWADEFMEGLKPTLAKYTFPMAKIRTIKGYTVYQVYGRDEANKTNILMNIFFIDGKSHSITAIIPDGKDPRDKDRFLTELYVNGR